MTRILCGLALAVHFLAVHTPAATYFVATNGSDSNSGTRSAPFRHVSYGANKALVGDTVIVMDGTYDNEGKVFNGSDGVTDSVVYMTNSGSAGAPITIMAQNRGKAILNAYSSTSSSTLPGCYGASAYFSLTAVNYITIQGFVIENACIVAVQANGTGTHGITLRWNEIKNIGNWDNSVTKYRPQGIFINTSGYNFTIDGNIFHDIGGGANINEQHGIYADGSNVTVVNNIFYNQLNGWDIVLGGAKNVYIANNTFAFPNPKRNGHIVLWDANSVGSLQNIVIGNNIFYQPRNTMLHIALSGGSVSNCTVQYNLTTVGGTEDLTSGCTFASNLMSTDPKLVNPSAAPYDFHLQPGSPAIGAGVPVPNLAVDFDGAPRSNGSVSDVGAYAFLAQTIPPIASIQNGASLVAAPVAPGEIVLLFGLGIGPEAPVEYSVDASGMVDTILAGVRVLFDGTPAPMIYASAAAVMVIVPYSVAGELHCRVKIEFNGAVSPDLDVPVVSSMPGIFTADRSGRGPGLIQNQDFSRNSAANPAAKGSVIVFYGTGEGRTDPPGIDGFVVTDVVRTPLLPVSVTIGGQTADVLYAGSEPGWACGMLQVYVRVPAGIASGTGVPLVLTVGGNSSAPGVTLAVL